MIAYVGQTRKRDLVRELARLGIGECTVRGELAPRRSPWFHDNGAYRDFTAGVPFNNGRWMRDMSRIKNLDCTPPTSANWFAMPEFVVIPDQVAAGAASLQTSAFWRGWAEGLPAYLAVQNGMTEDDVAAHLEEHADIELPYAGIFVGGDLPWKQATSPAWVAFAHARGMRCHVGRVGPAERVRWARDIGADSIDSCLPLIHHQHLTAFLGALA